MAEKDHHGRLSRQAAEGSIVALFIIAVLAAFARFLVRLHYQRRLFWDDAWLMVAIMLFSISLGLWFYFVNDMYFVQGIFMGSPISQADLVASIPRMLHVHTMSEVVLVLTWTSVCTVKFSFLSFFGSLINRTSRLRRYWWFVVGVTILTWAGGVPLEIVHCPYFDERSLSCTQGNYTKTLTISAIFNTSDIVSDLLIISIPVIILHRIKIPLRTKLVLGFSLCLSVTTIATSLIRMGGLKVPGRWKDLDFVWQVYWQYVEVSIGILVASATAFRTFFVQRATRHSAINKSTPVSQFAERFRERLRIRSRELDTESNYGLEGEIPGAEITGLRTLINDNGKTRSTDTMSGTESRESYDTEPVKLPEAMYRG